MIMVEALATLANTRTARSISNKRKVLKIFLVFSLSYHKFTIL